MSTTPQTPAHTAWQIGNGGEIAVACGAVTILDTQQREVARCVITPGREVESLPRCEANARLIAASPDLLAALKLAIEAIEAMSPHLLVSQMPDGGAGRAKLRAEVEARAAIARAESGRRS